MIFARTFGSSGARSNVPVVGLFRRHNRLSLTRPQLMGIRDSSRTQGKHCLQLPGAIAEDFVPIDSYLLSWFPLKVEST